VGVAGDVLGLGLDDVGLLMRFYEAFAGAMVYDGDPEPQRLADAARAELDAILHAELAWRFLAWALRSDPRLSEAALRAFQRTTREIERMPVVDYGVDSLIVRIVQTEEIRRAIAGGIPGIEVS
jgi:hypothetical protein